MKLCVPYEVEPLPAETLGRKKGRKGKALAGAGTRKAPIELEMPSSDEREPTPQPVLKGRSRAAPEAAPRQHVPPPASSTRSEAARGRSPTRSLSIDRPCTPPRRPRTSHSHLRPPPRRHLTPDPDFSDSPGCDVRELERPAIPSYEPHTFSPLDLGPNIVPRPVKRMRRAPPSTVPSNVARSESRASRTVAPLPSRPLKRKQESEEPDTLPVVYSPATRRLAARSPVRRMTAHSPLEDDYRTGRYEQERPAPSRQRMYDFKDEPRYPAYPQSMDYLQPPHARVDRGARQPPSYERGSRHFSEQSDSRQYVRPRVKERSPYYEEQDGYYTFQDGRHDEDYRGAYRG